MILFLASTVALLASTVALLATSGPALSPLARSWWSHIEYLAADRLEGRNTGSAGHREAAVYVARQFRRAGAKPGGTDGFLQPVPLVSRRIHEEQSGLWLVRDGKAKPLVLGEDANIGMGYEPAESLEAKSVFVGYGLSISEMDHDDLKGLDLRGKIAVYVQGGPSRIPGPLRAHAQSTEERWKALRAAGVIGVAVVPNPKFMDIPWERATLARLRASMTLADESLNETPGLKLSIRINPARAERFFEGSGHTFAEILALADSGVALPRFPLPAAIRARVSYERATIESQNVVGILPGSDPVLGHEYVVLSAHLDHLGIGGAIDGDSIYNGAMDNASGVATLIEIARLAKESGVRLRRSLVLLAVTAEEKGLEGSRFFMERPTVKATDIVANINMDMFLPIVPFRILTVYGLEESDLGDMVPRSARKFGAQVQNDLEPQRNLFIRSDQYSFIRRGVPALAFKIGYVPGSPEEHVFRDWIRKRYHAPSDDLAQPVNQEAAARFTRMLFDLCTQVANRKERPHWKDGSFFKRYAAGSAAMP